MYRIVTRLLTYIKQTASRIHSVHCGFPIIHYSRHYYGVLSDSACMGWHASVSHDNH